MSRMYRVVWVIDIEAETALEAAAKALDIQRDSDSIATVFSTIPHKDGGGVDFSQAMTIDVDAVEEIYPFELPQALFGLESRRA